MKHLYTSSLILSIIVLFSGCARAPESAVVAAREALTAAREAEADRYVADLYTVVADSFAAAETEIVTQNARNVFTRNYDRAEALLAFVTENAALAGSRVEEQKEIVRAENESLFAEIETTLTQVGELMARSPRGKDGVIALASIREDADLTHASLEEARRAQAAGDYIQAGAVGRAALEKAQGLVGELQHAIDQTGRRARS